MPMPNLPPAQPQPSEPTEQQKIESTIRAARDSVWVIEEELKLETFRNESLSLLRANVGHLEIVMADERISGSGQDLTDITSAITNGKQAITLLEGALGSGN